MHILFTLILLLISSALFSAILTLALKDNPRLRNISNVLISFMSFLIACTLVVEFKLFNFKVITLNILHFTNNISFSIQAEGLGIIFALLVSLLWPATIFYTISYLKDTNKNKKNRFFLFLNLSIMATFGIAFSGNLFTTFIFYEALTLLTYPLVTHSGTPEAKSSGRIYLFLLMGSSMILFLPAIILTYVINNTTNYTINGLPFNTNNVFIIIILIMFIFGTGKAAIMPFHKWLPRAMVAPAPASALLHAVAVVKSGIFVILKIIVYIFGITKLHYITYKTFGFNALLIIPYITVILASLVNIFEKNLKKILAYSTIGQLSYLLICILLLNRYGILAAILYLIAHSLAKIVLFFVAGAVIIFTHKENITDLPGISKKLPFMMVLFSISALSIVGIPFTSGFIAKLYLTEAIIYSQNYFTFIILAISSILITVYMFRIIYYSFFIKPEEEKIEIISSNSKSLPIQLLTMSLVITTIVTINIIIFFEYPYLIDFINPIIEQIK